MIWSVIPTEVIFGENSAPEPLRSTDYLGRKVLLRQGRVDTLLSTDPADFLDQRFFPGALLNKHL